MKANGGDAGSMISRSLLFGLFVCALAYLYTKWNKNKETYLDEIEQNILDAWNTTIYPPTRRFQRVAVGINCNLDLIVPAVDLMEALNLNPGKSLDSVMLDTMEDFRNTFTYYFTRGAAAERTFSNPKIFQHILKAAMQLDEKQHYIGGNAALMATKTSQMFDDITIQLAGPIGPGLKELLPPLIQIPASSQIATDEVHLIMEYGVGESWCKLTTPVANRFITSYDESNSELTMLQTFFSSLTEFSPDLVMLSGLHLLDGQDAGFIEERVSAVKEGLAGISPQVPVHLELASMANRHCFKTILDQIVPDVSSLGLNEQELAFASQVAGSPHTNVFNPVTGQPEIHKVGDIIYWILETYGHSKERKDSKLTRIHFHSLTYHVLGVVPSSWHNSKVAVAAGTQIAGHQACDVGQVTPEQVELRIPETFSLFTGQAERKLDPQNPVHMCQQGAFQFVFSPVLVCKQPLKTVGLGDAISATGLMFSHYSPPSLS